MSVDFMLSSGDWEINCIYHSSAHMPLQGWVQKYITTAAMAQKTKGQPPLYCAFVGVFNITFKYLQSKLEIGQDKC